MAGFLKKISRANRYLFSLALAAIASFFALVLGPFLLRDEDSFALQFIMLVFFVIAVAYLALRSEGRADRLREKLESLKKAKGDELPGLLRGIDNMELVLIRELLSVKKKKPAFFSDIESELFSRNLAGSPAVEKSLFILSERNSDPKNNSLSLRLSEKFILKEYVSAGYRTEEEDCDGIIPLVDVQSVTVSHHLSEGIPFKEDIIEIVHSAGGASGAEKKIMFSPFYIDQWVNALRYAGLAVDDKRKIRG